MLTSIELAPKGLEKPALRKEQAIKKEKFASQVKNTTDISLILEKILNTPISVSIHDLLGGMLGLHSQFFQSQNPLKKINTQKFGPQVNNYIYEMNAIKCSDKILNKILRGKSLYAVGINKVTAYLDSGRSLYIVMLDNEAEINLMHLDLAVKLGLIITILNYRQLLSANKLKLKFMGIAENTPVWIKRFYYNILFFIMDRAVTQNYMLKRFFKMQAFGLLE